MRNIFIAGRIIKNKEKTFRVMPEELNADGTIKMPRACSTMVNIGMGYKEEGAKYEKTELITVWAKGNIADYLLKFSPGDFIVISGKLIKKNGSVDKTTGKMYPPEWQVSIDRIENWPSTSIYTEEGVTTDDTDANNTPNTGLGGFSNSTGLGGNSTGFSNSTGLGNKPTGLGGNSTGLGANKPKLGLGSRLGQRVNNG